MAATRSSGETPRERDAVGDNLVLAVMLAEPFPCTLHELVLELEDQNYVVDAVARLVASGLAHRVRDFVFPTRAARRAAELQVGTG